MKPNELMVGDWFYIDEPDDFNGYVGKVVTINGETNYVTVHISDMHLHDVFVEDLQPISLTPKILEKNGFACADLPFEDFYAGYGLNIYGEYYADGNRNWYIICGTNVSMNVTHVHELQHALKLCGIEKEIIL